MKIDKNVALGWAIALFGTLVVAGVLCWQPSETECQASPPLPFPLNELRDCELAHYEVDPWPVVEHPPAANEHHELGNSKMTFPKDGPVEVWVTFVCPEGWKGETSNE